MSDHDWHEDAACKEAPAGLFFAPPGEQVADRDKRDREAKAYCRPCPVRTACLEYALGRSDKYGVWGGMNPEDRKREKRRRSRLPPPPKPPLVVEKLCGCCGVIQPVNAFGKDAKQKDGLYHWCKECTNEANRKRRREARQAVAS